MSRFVGTGRLVRLALRRDRVKLPIWILSISALTGVSVPALTEVYGTFEAQVAYAANVATSSIGRAFGGVPDGPSMGTIAMIEMFAFTSVLFAFMSTTAVVRHTRANEESGSAELIGSNVVGRYAPLTAVLIVVFGANIITGVIVSVLINQIEVFDTLSSFGFGMALAAVGMTFAAIAAITSQISSSARGANAMATIAIGGAYLLKAIGDGFATVNPDGLSATATWPTYLSPIGLGFQIFPFTQQNWWIFVVFAFVIVGLTSLSYYFLVKRDVGSGLIAERRGPAWGSKRLLSVGGISWRLQKGTLIGWAIFFMIFGLIFGGMANDFSDIIESVEFGEEYFGADGIDITTSFFGFMISFAGVIAAGYALMSLLKMRAEESSGRLESVLGAAVSRTKWMLGTIKITVIGVITLLFLISISAIITFGITGGNMDIFGDALIHSLLQVPAVIAFGGVTVLVFGVAPRYTVGVSWALFIFTLVLVQFAPLLELPQWLLNASPFSHTPQIIGGSINWLSLVVMLIIGVLLAVIGIYRFNQRDLDLE